MTIFDLLMIIILLLSIINTVYNSIRHGNPLQYKVGVGYKIGDFRLAVNIFSTFITIVFIIAITLSCIITFIPWSYKIL